MSAPFRLAAGGRIDRTRRISFSFDRKRYEGFAGDTLASALIANGVHLVGRSFKYHRPRGIMSSGSEEPNALVGVGADEAGYTPNLRATQVELYDGLVAESQNRWPSLGFDLGGANELFASLLPTGFYYKTFMWPPAAWKRLYEPVIRRAAGFGRAPGKPDRDRYSQVYAHCDVLIVGAGPAGLAAALTAAASGRRVIICDEQAEFGGSLLVERSAEIDGQDASEWVASAIADPRGGRQCRADAAHHGVRLVSRTTCWVFANASPIIPACRTIGCRASGFGRSAPNRSCWPPDAIERPLVFPENDRPGIMMAEAARTYVNRYGVKPGSNAVVFTACDSAYRAALDLKAGGVNIVVIADIRKAPQGPWIDRAKANGIEVRTGTVHHRDAGTPAGSPRQCWQRSTIPAAPAARKQMACDLILMSGGFTPSVHLFSQSRGKLTYNEELKSFIPGISVEAERSAGACRGVTDLADVLKDGSEAGRRGNERERERRADLHGQGREHWRQ